MQWLKAIQREVWSLFVDDTMLAVLSIVWIFFVGFVLQLFFPEVAKDWFGPAVLFSGFVIILVESVTRGARRARQRARHGNS